jgi:type IV pilus assembly protein PilV
MTFISNSTPKKPFLLTGRPFNQHGFSLLELLISLLIFVIGFLGIASLQHVSIRMAHDSVLQNTAIQLSSTLIEQLRVGTETVYLAQWHERVGKELPQGKASLVNHGDSYQLNLQWQESERSESDADLQSYQLTFKVQP